MVEIDFVKHTEAKEQLVDLFRLSFRSDMTEELWDWKYVQNPLASRHPEVVVAIDGGRIVGARPFLLAEMWLRGERVMTAQHCDTMVHPDYRNQGLFNRMGGVAIQHLKDSGYVLSYGFPNPMSRPGFLSQGWRVVVPMETLFRVLLPGKLITHVLKSRLLGSGLGLVYGGLGRLRRGHGSHASGTFEVEILDRYGECLRGVDDLRDRSAIDLVRDESYLRWRFDSHPEHHYRYVVATKGGELRGYGVISVEERENGLVYGSIVDYLVAGKDRDCFGLLVARCLEELEVSGCAVAQVWACNEPQLREELMRHFGFKSLSAFPYNRFTKCGYLDALRLDDGTVPDVDVYNRDSWRVTLAYPDTR